MNLIDKDALKAEFVRKVCEPECETETHKFDTCCEEAKVIENAPIIEALPVSVVKQLRFERDLAIHQLELIGKSLGERMDDVAKVVRCKDCKNYDEAESYCLEMLEYEKEYDFCSLGERKVGAE